MDSNATWIPDDYLHKVYAGVLGKLIGVYMGRPLKRWTYQQIMKVLGPVDYYVHQKFNLPCVVVDDDISGTFTFIRALDEHRAKQNISAEEIGHTWLNNVIERRTVLWWGGNGISTEHTAFLTLKTGIAAPMSGSMMITGQTLAEQIGAQTFIDGWAMVAPGNPYLAARLAKAAATVSHDGESVYAAELWAAMEAEAFVSNHVDHLLNTGLSMIPQHSQIANMIAQVRAWVKRDGHWQRTRQRIEDIYGSDKYYGLRHVIPNHAIMIMTLLYAGHDFSRAMQIVTTCGWDTDCNSGNVACLVAIMNGLSAFEGPKNWRGPVADQAMISSADGGYSINDAVRISYDIANLGLELAGKDLLATPSHQFHFSLPGAVQGFKVTGEAVMWFGPSQVDGVTGLATIIKGLERSSGAIDVSTPTFTPAEALTVSGDYGMMACPLLYPGQRLYARVRRDKGVAARVRVRLRVKAYDANDNLVIVDSDPIDLYAIRERVMADPFWIIPASLENMPIQQVGIAIDAPSSYDGVVLLNYLGWDGLPRITLRRPRTGSQVGQHVQQTGSASFWEKSWVSSVDQFYSNMGPSFFLAHDRGEGIIIHGTRQWTNYQATAHKFTVNLGAPAGLAIRVRGLNRYYAVVFLHGASIGLVKARDERRELLTSTPFEWSQDNPYEVSIRAQGDTIIARIEQTVLRATDDEYTGGGVGLVVTGGSLSVDSIDISPIENM